MVVQSVPASLDKREDVDFSSRVFTQFNAIDVSTALTPSGSALPEPETRLTPSTLEYEEFVLPDQYSIFLIRLGSEADDLATRYNTLLSYTHGLLNAIQQLNGVSVTSAKQ